MTSRLNVALIREIGGSLICSANLFDKLFMVSGIQVQDFNVCTVDEIGTHFASGVACERRNHGGTEKAGDPSPVTVRAVDETEI